MYFQIDHPLVSAQYGKENYRIEIDDSFPKGTCAIYFSSHNIYYPNSEKAFDSKIVLQGFYEWFKTRMPVHKHIFLRDIHKQWYLTGINFQINSPERLLEFLRTETAGNKIITIGSSAGGYAAVLYGSLLKAEKVFTFNGQMEIKSLLSTSNEQENPLVFLMRNASESAYYDLKPFLNPRTDIYYFYSDGSEWDHQQASHIQDTHIKRIPFKTAHHGVPFLACSLQHVIRLSRAELKALPEKPVNPLVFSVQCSGVFKVLVFSCELIFKRLKSRMLFFFET